MISASEARKKTKARQEEIGQENLNSMLADVEEKIWAAIKLGSYGLTYCFNTEQDLDYSNRLIGALVGFGYRVEDHRFCEYEYGEDYDKNPYIYINWFC